MTLSHISRLVKRATGRKWTELLQEKRLMRADELLLRTRLPVSEIMNLVGYTIAYFYRLYTQRFGLSPKMRRKARHAKQQPVNGKSGRKFRANYVLFFHGNFAKIELR